jgi:hypothetical protein
VLDKISLTHPKLLSHITEAGRDATTQKVVFYYQTHYKLHEIQESIT